MVAQGWFPVSTRSEKVASMGEPCLLAWPRVRVGVGLQREKEDQGPKALSRETLDSGNCFGPFPTD